MKNYKTISKAEATNLATAWAELKSGATSVLAAIKTIVERHGLRQGANEVVADSYTPNDAGTLAAMLCGLPSEGKAGAKVLKPVEMKIHKLTGDNLKKGTLLRKELISWGEEAGFTGMAQTVTDAFQACGICLRWTDGKAFGDKIESIDDLTEVATKARAEEIRELVKTFGDVEWTEVWKMMRAVTGSLRADSKLD